MKTKNLFLLPALIAGLGLIPAGRVTAQTFTTLHSFTPLIPVFTNSAGTVRHDNSDGAHPDADLILSGNTLYGTGWDGGSSNAGTVFKLNTDGTGFTILHKFTARSEEAGSNFANSDGAKPDGVLVLSGNTLYGTAAKGGSFGYGALFAVNTDGTGFTNLHHFTAPDPLSETNGDGASPYGGLVLSGDTLFGTAISGGSWGAGTVYKVNTSGSGFTTLHSFSVEGLDNSLGWTNADGITPNAGLILSGNTLYGTAENGGSSGQGTVFKVNTDGTGFTTLRSFTGGSDGGFPYGELFLSGSTLYGTAAYGGTSGQGTVFKINTDGTGFTVLHSFTALISAGVNSDGANPVAGLFLSGSTLYGTTFFGGTSGNGTVFAVHTDGTGFTNLHSFTLGTGDVEPINSDGANPFAGLILSGHTLYGTAQVGGSSRSGTIFSLSLPQTQLTITASGTNVILVWPTNYAEVVIQEDHYEAYFLQSTTDLNSPVVWTAVYPMPVAVNAQLVVTNSVSDTQRFYGIIKRTGPLSDVPCLGRGPNPGPCYDCINGIWTQVGNCRP